MAYKHARATLSRRSLLGAGLATVPALALTPAARALADPAARPDTAASIITPVDPQFASLAKGTNQRLNGSPDRVVMATTTPQVVAAVAHAVRTGQQIAVRSGGHCYEDFVTNSAVRTVIDLSTMDDVEFDAQRGAFAIGPGAQLGHVYRQLFKRWGVVVPAGNCPTVAAGGHFAGGGYGSLSRRNGLSVDHLYAVEVVHVTAAGEVRVVVATREANDPNRDLWFAHTGGGGGNFGVVTRYWFRSPGSDGRDPSRALPAPPSSLLISEVAWPWERIDDAAFATLMRNHGTWHERNSAPNSPQRNLFSQLKPFHRSNGSIVLDTSVDAGAPNAEGMLSAYVQAVGAGLPAPKVLQHRTVPWLQSTTWGGFTGPDSTTRFKGKSTYLRRSYPEAQIRVMHRHLNRTDFANAGALMMIASYGGQVNAVSSTATASQQRDSIIKHQVVSLWNDAADDAANMAWVREFYRDLYAGTGGVPISDDVTDGCFVNYADVDLSDPAWNSSGVHWGRLYYKDAFTALRATKRRWDPLNVFRHSQSIPLS